MTLLASAKGSPLLFTSAEAKLIRHSLLLLLLFIGLPTVANATCLNSCRDHCLGTCSCIAHSTPDCNCNIFQCNCDCCKPQLCSGPGPCYCNSSTKEAKAKEAKPPTPDAPVCGCDSPCCSSTGVQKPPPDPETKFKQIDTDKDNRISYQEMVDYLKADPELQTLLRAFDEKELRARYFAPMDRNHDGVLTREEFDAQLAEKPQVKPPSPKVGK